MESKILEAIGIDPGIIFIIMFIFIIILFSLLMNLNMKYNRMKTNYASFMRGKSGKNLEKSILEKFKELDEVTAGSRQCRKDVKEIYRKLENCYQKVGIVKYDAFHEMGGKLSFAITLLDNNNNGWLLNAMHSRDGCYTYIKEIVKGQSYIELSEEESESLERAVYQEIYGMDIEDIK